MSDLSQGSGWWQASSGKWYPPELDPQLAIPAPPSGPDSPPGPTTNQQMHSPAPNRPSYVPTVLISLFFGLFGLIPAIRHSRMARGRGFPERGYWWAFGSILAGEVLVGVVLPVVLLVVLTSAAFHSTPRHIPPALPSNGTHLNPIRNREPGRTPTGSWSTGRQINTKHKNYTLDSIISASCPTTSFCVAVGDGGYEFTYSGGSWSAGRRIDSNAFLSSISCPTVSFCVAADPRGYVFTYSGGSWSAGRQIDTKTHASVYYGAHEDLNSVSCPTTSFCVAVGLGGFEFTYSGGSWSPGRQIDTNTFGQGHHYPLSSVSCASASFCVAVGTDGYEFTYSGGSWSAGQKIATDALDSVSCPTAGFCVAVGLGGYSLTDSQLRRLSARAARRLASRGYSEFTFSGGSWSPGLGIGTKPGLDSVSCPTTGFCVAVDSRGNEYTYSGGSWSPGRRIDTNNFAILFSVSCPTAGFCVAVDAGGYEYTYSREK
ncbi:MAG: hypothetical protein M0008_04900 [Actinomycetota bacterium]|nr:hypothetical protein [Actinomycetota bacterium]